MSASMSALFSADWLIDTFAAVTLLIALVLLLRAPVARAFGPGIAYALWLLPLTRMVMPGIILTVDAPLPTAPSHIITVVAGGAAPAAFDPLPWLIALWLAGAALLAGQALWATLRLRRAVLADGVLREQHGRIRVLMSAAVDGPVAMGIIAPLVVLPPDFAARFTPVEQQQVLAHEIEHHRGNDLVITLAAFALLALNWFNPIAWLGWRAFRQDQEAACDARTLARLGGEVGHDRATYGRAIATAATGHIFRPTTALTLAMGEKSAILYRLRSLAMTEFSTRRRWAGRAALAIGALFALPMTASVSYAVEQQAEPPAPPAAPATPALPRVIVIQGDDASETPMNERRIEQGGRTIILRSTEPLSDAHVAAAIAEAEAEAGSAPANGEARAPRVIVRTHSVQPQVHVRTGAGDVQNSTTVPPTPPVPPVPPVPPSDGQVRRQSVFVYGNGVPAVNGAGPAHCGPGTPQRIMAREIGDPASHYTLRIVSCGDGPVANHIAALRSTRAALARLNSDQMPTAANTRALAEIDREIAELERAPGQ